MKEIHPEDNYLIINTGAAGNGFKLIYEDKGGKYDWHIF